MTQVNVTPVETTDNSVDQDTVGPVPDTPVPGPFRADAPDSAPSPLATLKAKLATVTDELYIDLEVPRWDEAPPNGRGMGLKVFVRYRPISPSLAVRLSERFQKLGAPDWETQANAQLLAEACIGVYAKVPGDDTAYSLRPDDPTGSWTRMDPDLASMLGPVVKDGKTAVGVCRALYCTDGDLTAAALALADWSAQASEKADKGFQRP